MQIIRTNYKNKMASSFFEINQNEEAPAFGGFFNAFYGLLIKTKMKHSTRSLTGADY